MTKIERDKAHRQRLADNLTIFLRDCTSPLGMIEASGHTDQNVIVIKAKLSVAASYLTQLNLFPQVDMAVKMNGSFVTRKSGLLYVASEGTEKIFFNQEGKLYVSTQAITSERGLEIPLFEENQPDVDDGVYIRFFSVALTAVDEYFRSKRAKANIFLLT